LRGSEGERGGEKDGLVEKHSLANTHIMPDCALVHLPYNFMRSWSVVVVIIVVVVDIIVVVVVVIIIVVVVVDRFVCQQNADWGKFTRDRMLKRQSTTKKALSTWKAVRRTIFRLFLKGAAHFLCCADWKVFAATTSQRQSCSRRCWCSSVISIAIHHISRGVGLLPPFVWRGGPCA